MSSSMPQSPSPNRKDHITPQGYLRGFIHPEQLGVPRPLWVFHVQTGRWYRRNPSEVGFERGYYDYAASPRPDASADDAFMRIENEFPRVREQIRRDGYANWPKHRELLVAFAGMMAARSVMFRGQAEAEVLGSLRGHADGESLAKNYAITRMRSEIEARRQTWQAWDWALGYTVSPADPIVTSDQAVGMWGNAPDQATAHTINDFWIWCPLSWDMCLIGSSQPLAGGRTRPLEPNHLSEIRRRTRSQASRFVVSPVRLENLDDKPTGD